MQKQNKTIIIVIVLLILALGAFFFLRKGDSKIAGTNNSNGSVFTSIKDALSKDVSLICEFSDENGVSTKSYVKNGAVRVSSTGGAQTNQSSDVIIKDKKMYMWDLKTKQGFVYTIPEEEDSKVGMTATEVNQSDSYLNMIEAYKDSCKVSTVSDSYFETPTDVEFQDMSKLLEDLKNQMPSNIPSY